MEKHAIGSETWAGEPFYCSTSGASSLVNNTSLCSDIYILGKGVNKKCFGFAVDNNVLRVGMTDTVERDLSFPMSSGQQFGRIPPAFIRAVKDDKNRLIYAATMVLHTFSTSENELSLTANYYTKDGQIVVIFSNNNVFVIDADSVAFVRSTDTCEALHFSLNDDFMISNATYSYSADNTKYASNKALNYCMSYNPFYLRTASVTPLSVNVSLYSHSIFRRAMEIPSAATSYEESRYTPGMDNTSVYPGISCLGFPRIDNSEIYIKKMYIPMTKPAETSPLKIGFVPGLLTVGNVYKINDKYFVALNSGVWGLFAEVEDQGD